MNNLIREVEGGTIWPYSVPMLRRDEPTKGFSDQPADEILAQFDVFRVQPSEVPVPDPATERVVEVHPEKLGGVWVQRWELQELTQAEKDAIFRAVNPPQWQAFGQAVWSNPLVAAMMFAGAQNPQTLPLTHALSVGLDQAAMDQQYTTFTNAVHAAVAVGLLSGELLQTLQGLAVQFRLPAEFVAGLEVQP